MGRVRRYKKFKACDPFSKKSRGQADTTHDEPPNIFEDREQKEEMKKNKIWDDENRREKLLQRDALRMMKKDIENSAKIEKTTLEAKRQDETMKDFKLRIRQETRKTLREEIHGLSATAKKRKLRLKERKEKRKGKGKKGKGAGDKDEYSMAEEVEEFDAMTGKSKVTNPLASTDEELRENGRQPFWRRDRNTNTDDSAGAGAGGRSGGGGGGGGQVQSTYAHRSAGAHGDGAGDGEEDEELKDVVRFGEQADRPPDLSTFSKTMEIKKVKSQLKASIRASTSAPGGLKAGLNSLAVATESDGEEDEGEGEEQEKQSVKLTAAQRKRKLASISGSDDTSAFEYAAPFMMNAIGKGKGGAGAGAGVGAGVKREGGSTANASEMEAMRKKVQEAYKLIRQKRMSSRQ